jgi:putative lipoic acid-binding regulatory protein
MSIKPGKIMSSDGTKKVQVQEQEDIAELCMTFPCSFPLKVMGLNENDYPAYVLEVGKKYIQGIDKTNIKTRLSKSEKYVAVTLTFLATDKAQIDTIYQELNASDRTYMAI